MTYICADFGSTWTKVCAVEPGRGLVATASAPTSLSTDVMDAFDLCQARLAAQGVDVESATVLACSSAGGGLRIAVVGNERLVTGEAGRRVSLSSGGHVVGIFSGGLAPSDVEALLAARPDLILLTGGTNGGNATTLLACAQVLADVRLGIPVIVAGNEDAAEQAVALLADEPHTLAPNVVPEIGVFQPGPARERVRAMFLTHVIGGKGLSKRPEFAELVLGATPDVVLRGTEVLASVVGDVVVVDVGGATTDVHSVVEVELPAPHPEEHAFGAAPGATLARDVVGVAPATRTVEGDLGMRWSAATTVAAGQTEELLQADPALAEWVTGLVPGELPTTDAQVALDAILARTALCVALRRHAGRTEVRFVRGRREIETFGTDVRAARLLVGSGGVLRADPVRGAALVAEALQLARTPGRMLPAPDAAGHEPRIVVDADYLLAPIGLLAEADPELAQLLARSLANRTTM